MGLKEMDGRKLRRAKFVLDGLCYFGADEKNVSELKNLSEIKKSLSLAEETIAIQKNDIDELKKQVSDAKKDLATVEDQFNSILKEMKTIATASSDGSKSPTPAQATAEFTKPQEEFYPDGKKPLTEAKDGK